MKGLDLRKFKKIASDEHSTTLAHPAGHTIKIAHEKLHPATRGQLASLPMSKGGDVKKGTSSDPTAEHLTAGDKIPNKIEKEVVSDTKKKMADGGQVAGEEINYDKLLPQEAEANAPFGAPVAPEMPAQPQMAMPMAAEQPQIAQAPQQAPQTAPAQPQIAPSPDMSGGYQKQLQGIEAASKAQQQMSNAETAALAPAVKQQVSAEQEFQKHLDGLMKEHAAFQQDVQNSHIDPSHYMNSMGTGAKVSTAIGLILGGMGAGVLHQENPAMKFLNQQIENDIHSQQLNLGKKESLLSANMRQFGNVRDAADMTRAMQAGIVATQLKQAATNAATPMAKANALKAAGELEAHYAPIFQQLAIRQTLQGAQNGTSQADPATFVRYVVPEPHQKAVFGEIERAQDTRRMGDTILKSFDAAATDTRPMSGGALKNVLPGITSPHVLAFHQSMQPTFKDLEGTVRQAAMDNTFKNLSPALGDSDSTIQIKRNALQDYLRSKESAPTAKGFGIDLDKFASTTDNPLGRLAPQQRAFAEHALKNPNDPRSAIVLKKLGIK